MNISWEIQFLTVYQDCCKETLIYSNTGCTCGNKKNQNRHSREQGNEKRGDERQKRGKWNFVATLNDMTLIERILKGKNQRKMRTSTQVERYHQEVNKQQSEKVYDQDERQKMLETIATILHCGMTPTWLLQKTQCSSVRKCTRVRKYTIYCCADKGISSSSMMLTKNGYWEDPLLWSALWGSLQGQHTLS